MKRLHLKDAIPHYYLVTTTECADKMKAAYPDEVFDATWGEMQAHHNRNKLKIDDMIFQFSEPQARMDPPPGTEGYGPIIKFKKRPTE